ncbi:DUF2130 domain-containing protein [Streptococcus equi subsp. zooepidemicus]|uniref:DUF2130 domain-containing protein n=1 Tax=Streptococcus equi TaxID=1336 RepID=UPI0010CAAEED|nr:DUF2130 domain-containing protein [Streptococcus equi]MCD3410692.1 DUF2130 domain-containing protein [Streptococcus equi subsp. zooepidemicus]MCD3452913.1 DUF2130 domain-containing protein [Streptococcus equi subsp. zooepidemicus]MDI6076804.1 DUF2130 domain-containing protein [Streptococcus equi subsp. zooepidemicus]VTS24068.1 Serine/threonine-protein kinase MRCK beta [Streptococcus equi subsp. zooepidemicus]HEL0648550.1 DUF2130 domain-containing protein [Streptococcus equi subsp. zooepidem
MKELKCPHCHTLFTVNESDYSQILAQVRGQEFDKELAQRLESEMKLQEARANSRFQEVLTKKEQAIQSLTNRLERIEQEQAYLRQQELAQKDKELLELHNQLDKLELEQQSRLQSALTVVEKERDYLKNQLVLQEKESELSLASVRSDYEVQLKAVNEQVEFYKNFKAQQSTKAIGESLELYAETEFNKVRSYAFPNASFTKDNQVSQRGSKGDYIYRELDSNGVEILSIMFEMKNEADTTKTKHKNSDFFKELDKDRREKNCEYAVLVTMLEADNDYYNAGIVDVSHDYDKMYVVRPQLFIHLIGLLRNAALNSLKYKQELALVREQHIDITHFEEDLEQFKHAFAKNYQSASNNFKKAIDEIDKSIKRMEEVKRFLTTSENQLRLANNKLDDVSVKKLTRNNPTMRDKFQAIKP